MKFYQWLKKQTERNSPVGDFARDSLRDGTSAEVGNTFSDWENHLCRFGACKEARSALLRSWEEYEKVAR